MSLASAGVAIDIPTFISCVFPCQRALAAFKKDMSVADYTARIKEICDSLASINVTSKLEEVWYVDSGASNHMRSHEEWFSFLEKSDQPGVVETGDDTPHPIMHVREVPLATSDRGGS